MGDEIFPGLCHTEFHRPLTKEILKDFVAVLDIDQSGYIEWGEWLALAFLASLANVSDTTGLFKSLLTESTSPVIRLLDAATGDGVVSLEDLLAIASPVDQHKDSSSSGSEDLKVPLM